jgi:hypothetical protein
MLVGRSVLTPASFYQFARMAEVALGDERAPVPDEVAPALDVVEDPPEELSNEELRLKIQETERAQLQARWDSLQEVPEAEEERWQEEVFAHSLVSGVLRETFLTSVLCQHWECYDDKHCDHPQYFRIADGCGCLCKHNLEGDASTSFGLTPIRFFPVGPCPTCKGVTPLGAFETKEDGSRRSLKSFSIPHKEWEAMLKTLNGTFKRTSSEPNVQTLDPEAKTAFFAAVKPDFAK